MPNYKLYQGDCLEVMKNIEDRSIDLILTDPPYGTTACKWDSIIPFEPMWEQLNRIIKSNGAIVLFGSEPFSSALRMSNIKNYKYDWVWEKHKPSNFAMSKKQPMKYHENIMVFYKMQCHYCPQRIERTSQRFEHGYKNNETGLTRNLGELNNLETVKHNYKDYDYKTKLPSSVLKIPCVVNSSKEKVNHPTQKPVTLLEYLIKTYTLEGETVLDFTMGSGSTGVACLNTNRNFIGIELDEGYFNIAQNRLEEAANKTK